MDLVRRVSQAGCGMVVGHLALSLLRLGPHLGRRELGKGVGLVKGGDGLAVP